MKGNVSRNGVHVSLNFDASEKISSEQLKEIADTYKHNKIGFGEQSYLVYQHFDAGHPHIYIVSIKVRANGSRVDTHDIGRNQSENARKEIETTYGLMKAESMKNEGDKLKSAYAAKIQYGKSESRQAILKVLEVLIKTYKYTLLCYNLNVVLRQYNAQA